MRQRGRILTLVRVGRMKEFSDSKSTLNINPVRVGHILNYATLLNLRGLFQQL